MIIGRICTFYELFPQFCSHITEKMCNFALSMKHRRLDKYVTLYTVCREGGKVIYSYVETLPQHRLQDRSLKEFYRQVEEHGYDVITPSDKDYEQVVKALNVVSKKDAMNDEMSSYNHYKPEEICTCGRWIFFEHMPYYDEKEQKDIVYRSTKKKSSEAQPAKSKEKMASVRVPAYQKESVKRFFDWLKEANASGDSILGAVRAAEYILEDKVAQDSALSEQYKKDLALLKELEEKLPRL